MNPFYYLTLFMNRFGRPLRRSEQLRSMALLKGLIAQAKSLGWTDNDFEAVYIKTVDLVVKNPFINSFGFVYGPIKGMLDQAHPKVVESTIQFTEEEIQKMVENYKRLTLRD